GTSMIITGADFSNNGAGSFGGGAITDPTAVQYFNLLGLIVPPITATISNCTFTGNSTSGGGRAILNFECSMSLVNDTFTSNSAAGDGGAVLNTTGGVAATNLASSGCTFSGNTATGNGGAIANEVGGTLTITGGTTFSTNQAFSGGAIYNLGSLS